MATQWDITNNINEMTGEFEGSEDSDSVDSDDP